MPPLRLFTDGSADSKTRIGYGAYLAVSDMAQPLAALSAAVNVKQFENTSSTRLELQTLIWALHEAAAVNLENAHPLIIHTDSQNIITLLARRHQLEKSDYVASSGKRLNNAELYRAFFTLMDQLNCQLVKVAGHKAKYEKDGIDLVFSLVDKASRAALRGHVKTC
jgi:ribonuclease HI